MAKEIDTKNWPVMKTACATCPFGPNGDPMLAAQVLSRNLFQSSQICHHPRLHGKKQTHLCRGQRDEQLLMMHRLGWISAPTDEAFNDKQKELGL